MDASQQAENNGDFIMTAISHWFRGFRRALRDVQYGIARHAHSINDDDYRMSIYFSITMNLSIYLRDLKHEDSTFLQLVRQKETGFRQEALTGLPSSEIPRRVLFEDGYLSGFSAAIIIVQKYKASMNDPAAHAAISPLIDRLKKVQTQLSGITAGKLRTLKRCKYVI